MLGLALAAAVIAVSHPDRIWASLQQVELLPLIGALALNVPVVVLRAYRAQVVVAHLDHRVSMIVIAAGAMFSNMTLVNDTVSGNRANGGYVALHSPNRRDYSTIVETVDATAAQTLAVTVAGGLSTGTVHVVDLGGSNGSSVVSSETVTARAT